jgi:hypothetical protein
VPDERLLLDVLLAQTLITGLSEAESKARPLLDPIARTIRGDETLPPIMGREHDQTSTARPTGPDFRMGPIDFACPSQLAPREKRQLVLTLHNRPNGAEVDVFRVAPFDHMASFDPMAPSGNRPELLGTILVEAGAWATEIRRHRQDRRPASRISLSATASHFAVALGDTLWIHPLICDRDKLSPAPPQARQVRKFDSPIEWIEFDRAREGAIAIGCSDREVFGWDLKGEIRDLASPGHPIVGFAHRQLWYTNGWELERMFLQAEFSPSDLPDLPFRRWPPPEPMSGKGAYGSVVTMSKDGSFLAWYDSHHRVVILLGIENGEPTDYSIVPAVRGSTRHHPLILNSRGIHPLDSRHEIQVSQSDKVAVTEGGIVVSLSDEGIRIHSPTHHFRSREGWWLGHQTQSKTYSASIFGNASVIGRVQDGIATLWSRQCSEIFKDIPMKGIVSLQSAGDFLFVLYSVTLLAEYPERNTCRRLAIVDVSRNKKWTHSDDGLNVLLAAHESGKCIAVSSNLIDIQVVSAGDTQPCRVPCSSETVAAWSPDGDHFALASSIAKDESNPWHFTLVDLSSGEQSYAPVRLTLPEGDRIHSIALGTNSEFFFCTDKGWLGRGFFDSGQINWIQRHHREPSHALIPLVHLGTDALLLAASPSAVRIYNHERRCLHMLLLDGRPNIIELLPADDAGLRFRIITLVAESLREEVWSVPAVRLPQ